MMSPILNSISINGLILAGGKSSRMGRDKSLISFHGKPQREFLLELLKPFCKSVFLSCKKNDPPPQGLNPVVDRYDIESPLNGILSAFDHDASATWLTVPVDMPMIDAKTISYLLENRDIGKIATCFFDSDGVDPEPLFTLWEPSSYPLLKDFYSQGKISPRDFLKQSDINLLTIPDKSVLTNINSEEELEKFIAKRRANS